MVFFPAVIPSLAGSAKGNLCRQREEVFAGQMLFLAPNQDSKKIEWK